MSLVIQTDPQFLVTVVLQPFNVTVQTPGPQGAKGEGSAGGSSVRTIRGVTATGLLTGADNIVHVSGAADIELTLPTPPASNADQFFITVKKYSTGLLFVRGTVDGYTDIEITSFDSYNFYTYQGAWFLC